MSDVYDLDAVAAEVLHAPFRFRYKGRDWEMTHMRDVDWRVVERADAGDIQAVREAFRLAFGDDQYAEFERLPQPASVMAKLFTRWRDHAGLDEGESPASPTSSGSTAGPSKRPSRSTTRASASATSTPVS